MSRRRRSSKIVEFFEGFNAGYSAMGKVVNAVQGSQVNQDIKQVEADFTPRQVEAASGQDALAAGRQAYDAALANATSAEQQAQIEQQFAPTLRALEADIERPASIIKSMGVGSAFQQRNGGEFSPQEVEGAKAQARARIYSAAGRGEDAARTLLNAERTIAIADQDELRKALTPPSGLHPSESNRNEALRSNTASGPDITQASAVPEHTDAPAAQPATAGQPATNPASQGISQVHGFRDPLEHYATEVLPKAVTTLVKQGHIDQAARYVHFMQSQQGYEYAKLYTSGLRKYAIGDHQGALGDFEQIYNRDLYPDGRRAQLTALKDGQMRIDQYDADGKLLGSRTGKIADLTEQAALALNPIRAVEFMAQQKAKRNSEAALLDRQTSLEQLRQEGREAAEDRRDARLVKQIEAANSRAANRGGLTAAQERGNAEIDSARERIHGMDPAEIRRRTAKQTDTGRENDQYDPSLARAASLASRRKIGQDDAFDSRENTPKAPAFDLEDVRKRFRSDRKMDNYTLGNMTPQGVEVLQNGRVVGHYR